MNIKDMIKAHEGEHKINGRNIVSGAVLLAAILAVFGWLGKVLIAGLVGTIKGL